MERQTEEEILKKMGMLREAFKEFRVVARRVIAPDKVQLGVELSIEGEAAPPMGVTFDRVDNRWTMNLPM
jgi:hypothetical protein